MTQQTDTTKDTDVAVQQTRTAEVYRGEAAIMQRMEALFLSIPLVDTDSLAFVARNLNVADVSELIGELENKLPKAEDVAGRQLKITDITRNASTVDDSPFAWYLIIDSTDTQTGDPVLWQTSAGDVTSKLLRIYEANRLPAVVETRLADKTRRGYNPVNLIVHALGGTA